MFVLVLAAALATADVSAATTADAQPPIPVAAPPATAKTDDSDKIICHREIVGGTLFTERVCTTRAQREAGGKVKADADDHSGPNTAVASATSDAKGESGH